MKEVSASVDVSNSKFAEALKSKYTMQGMQLVSETNPVQGSNTLDTSISSSKKFSTPSSVKKFDSDYEEQHWNKSLSWQVP